jgi:O-antigen/teichoic acid export membrane protein
MSFLISIYQVYNEWCIREAQFKNLSINKVVNSGSITLGNLLFGLVKFSDGGLIWGELFGRFITALTCISNVVRRDFDAFRHVTISRMRSLSIHYQNVPKFILPGQLLNTIAGQSSILLIAFFFGDKEVGYYSMTGLVLSVPASLISNTVRDVFRQQANTEYQAKRNCLDIYKKTIITTALFSFSIFAVLFLILPGLFSFVFGTPWRLAGEYAQIITPTIMISFVAESVWGVFIITEKMKAILAWQIQFLIFTISSILIGYYVFGTMKMVLICYVIARSLCYLTSIFMTYTFAKGDI